MSDKSKGRSPAEIAERAQRRRTRMIWAQSILFLAWQGSYFVMRPEPGAVLRLVDQVRLGAFLFWAAALLFLLTFGGAGILARPEVQRIVNDEVTREHRRSAFVWGYWGLILGLFGLYILAMIEPINPIDAAHLLLSAGVVVPLLRFALLERRSEADG